MCSVSVRLGSGAGDSPCVHPSAGRRRHHREERTAHQAAEPLRWRLHQGKRHVLMARSDLTVAKHLIFL